MRNQTFEFEKLVSEAFKIAGFKILEISSPDIGYDFVLKLNKKPEFAVEVKYYKSKHPQTSLISAAAQRLIESAKINRIEKAILVVSCDISADLRLELEEKYKITFVDRVDLLIMTAANTELHDTMRSMFEGDEYTGSASKELIIKKIQESKLKITTYQATITLTPKRDFCSELRALSPGKKHWRKYEDLCSDILKHLFDNNLNGWHRQKRTDDGLSRYDLICRIIPSTLFWEFLIANINSRYVLFEFKNYVGKIKQGQILTTEKYLLTKALRSVAFVISRKGPDRNGIQTIQGAMREHGKLMVPLTDDDLCEMLSMKNRGDDPSDYLFNLADDFLMALPR